MQHEIRHALAWLAFLSLAVAPAARADDATAPGPWKYGAVVGLNVSQSAYSSNWKGGDRGALVWVLSSDLTADRQFNEAFHLSNHLQLAYGQTSRQSATDGGLTWDRPEKSTDQIAFESVGRFSTNAWVEPYLALNLESQFRDQSSSIGVLNFNPVQIKESAGLARVLADREDAKATTRLGFGFRQTFARSFVDPVTKATDSYVSNDGGVEWKTEATWPLLGKKVLYKGDLLVYQPVFYSKSKQLEDYDREVRGADPGAEAIADFWRATDVSHHSTFSAQITKHLQVNLNMAWVYDKFDAAANVAFAADATKPLVDRIAEIRRNVRKGGQFKEVLALGLTYQLF